MASASTFVAPQKFIQTRDFLNKTVNYAKPAGFEDVQPLIAARVGPVWVNAGVLSDDEIANLRRDGIELSVFFNPIDPSSRDAIESDLAVVEMHHPGERIWVEILAAELI